MSESAAAVAEKTDKTETETKELPNKVEVVDAGPSLKRLSIEIPAETVDAKLAESMDTLSMAAAIPGFRKGRVPKNLIEKRFGTDVRNEARGQLVSAAAQKAVEDLKLKMIGDAIVPDLDKVTLAAGKPLAFTIEIETLPEFDLPAFEGLKVRKPLAEITDEMVKGELEKLRINEGELQERHAPEPGDYLTGHGVMTGPEGKEFHNIQGCVVQIPTPDKNGKGMILGVVVEDFDKQFGRPKAGETVTIKTKGPEQHEIEAVRGADLAITFTVSRIDRILPAPVEKVSQNNGFEDEEGLVAAIRLRLEQRLQIEQQSLMRQQVARHLLNVVKMDLPRRLSERQARRNLERRRFDLMHRGVDETKIEEHIADLRAASAATAQQDLKLFFILNKIAEDRGVKVEESEINGWISQMAFSRNVRPDRLRQEFIRTGQIGSIYQQIREHKTMGLLLDKAEVTEMSVEDYNKAMKEEAAAKPAA